MGDTADMGSWMLGLVAFTSLTVNLILVWKSVVGRAERRIVSFVPDAARREEFERHVKANQEEHAKLFAKISGVERGMRDEMRAEYRGMESHIEAMRKENKHDIEGLHSRITNLLGELKQWIGAMKR